MSPPLGMGYQIRVLGTGGTQHIPPSKREALPPAVDMNEMKIKHRLDKKTSQTGTAVHHNGNNLKLGDIFNPFNILTTKYVRYSNSVEKSNCSTSSINSSRFIKLAFQSLSFWNRKLLSVS
jgi:hypothetical protein